MVSVIFRQEGDHVGLRPRAQGRDEDERGQGDRAGIESPARLRRGRGILQARRDNALRARQAHRQDKRGEKEQSRRTPAVDDGAADGRPEGIADLTEQKEDRGGCRLAAVNAQLPRLCRLRRPGWVECARTQRGQRQQDQRPLAGSENGQREHQPHPHHARRGHPARPQPIREHPEEWLGERGGEGVDHADQADQGIRQAERHAQHRQQHRSLRVQQIDRQVCQRGGAEGTVEEETHR